LLYRLKSLKNLRRPYLDELVFFIESRPSLSFIANLFIIPSIFSKRLLTKYLRKQQTNNVSLTAGLSSLSKQQKPLNQIREIPSKPDVLLIVEASIAHCFRYRVQQKIEQLESLNLKVNWVAWNDEALASQELHFAHIIIFYRVPAFDGVIQLINKAQALNKVIIYDTDDLIFDEEIMKENTKLFSGLDKKEMENLITGARLYHQAISLCDYTIGSTPVLCEQLQKIKPSFLHRNVLDKEILDFIHFKQQAKLKRNFISIFYGSGTKTHNHDFELIKQPLLKILEKYSQVRLTIIGYLQLSDDFNPYLDRIDRMGLLSSEAYWQVLQYADINLAPLQAGIFADCKSEIKWMEAAIMKIPSIVSATQTYNEIIENGKTAFLASDEETWYQYLSDLINNPELRKQIAEQAYTYALEQYHPDKAATNLKGIFKSAISKTPKRYKECSSKKNVVFVNVCFPPDGLGGATAVVINQIEGILQKYGSEYTVSVFTIDFQNTLNHYQLREYIYHNIHVTAVSVPPGIDLDWRYHDQHIYELFLRYVQFNNADLIHFHSIQRLTASVMDVAVKLKLPHVVTLHDSWWLCDRQFMINHKKIDCEQHQVDPLVCAKCLDDDNNSILRRLSLAEKLKKADALLTVSNYQCQLYKENGFNSTIHKNGIILDSPPIKTEDSNTQKLKLAYVGGICTHKGYYFLKSIYEKLALLNCELTIIDFSLAEGESKQIKWGDNPVNTLAKIDFDKMPAFYRSMDVLIVPSMWRESFGLISREAAIQGAWIVAADAGGLAEDIIPGVNGNIFEKSNTKQLEDILKNINEQPEKFRNSGNKRKGTENIFSIEQNVDELVSIYRSLLT